MATLIEDNDIFTTPEEQAATLEAVAENMAGDSLLAELFPNERTVDDMTYEYAAREDAEMAEAPVPAPVVDTTADLSSLVSKTVFLRVRYGSIGNSRKVPGANVLTTDADVSFLRVSKTLLESNELEAIRKHDTSLRKWLGNTCLPYDIGIMLLPVGLIQQTEVKLKEHKTERDTLIDAFIAAYPTIKQEAQKQLGTLYNESEYPSVSEIKDKFRFEWQYINFGIPGQLQKVNPELYKQEQEKAAAQLQEAATEVVAVMRGTLYDMVNHLKDRLTPDGDGKPKILKESAVNKLKEFLDSFDLRNVTDDKALAVEVQKVRSLLGGTTAVALRSSDEFREKLRKGMENVTDSLGSMVEVKSGRKFRE